MKYPMCPALSFRSIRVRNVRRRNPSRRPRTAANGKLSEHPNGSRRRLRLLADRCADRQRGRDRRARRKLRAGRGYGNEAQRTGEREGPNSRSGLETLTLASGKVYKFSPHLSAVDSGETGQKVVGGENTMEQAPGQGQDAERIAILAGSGAGIGGIADRSWRGAGIGAGVGSAVGLATVLLTRGKEVELRQGSTLDVVFDRPVSLE